MCVYNIYMYLPWAELHERYGCTGECDGEYEEGFSAPHV